MKKLQLPINKKKLVIIVVVLTILLVGTLLFIHTQNQLTEEQKRQLAETEQVLKAGEIKQTVNTTTLQEISSSISGGKNHEAKDGLFKLLANEGGLTISEKRSAYTALALVCPRLADFECIDKVIQFQKQDELIDYFFIVDAARLAKEKGNADQSKRYYSFAYEEIQVRGGEDFVLALNEQTQAPLDYAEIKNGAGK